MNTSQMTQLFSGPQKCMVFCIVLIIVLAVQIILNLTNLFNIITISPPTISTHDQRTAPQSHNTSNAAAKQHLSERTRVVMSLTAVPSEIPDLVNATINDLLTRQTYTVDVIYLNIPYMQLRNDNKLYPSTKQLHDYFPQQRVLINRILADSGPTTRYLGAIEHELEPDTLILTMDYDPFNFHEFTIQQLVEYAEFDPSSVFTIWGENILWNPDTNYWAVDYWRYPWVMNDTARKCWQKVEVLRAVNGVAFRRRWFDDFWFNATDYHVGCFWTDDHWFSFNMERQGVDIKLIHDYEQAVKDRQERETNNRRRSSRRLGTLTKVNQELKSESSCTIAIMKEHPNIWKLARDSAAHEKRE